jgi:hypothetical protein
VAIRRESDIMEGLRGWQAISEEMESGSCLWIDVEMEMEMVYYCRDEVYADGTIIGVLLKL